MNADEYLSRHGKNGLRPERLASWVGQGGDLEALVRLIWERQPEVVDSQLDMRLLSGVSEERLWSMGRLALDWFIAHPRDELSAEILSHVSFQAPWIIHERLQDFGRALAEHRSMMLSPMLLEGVAEEKLLRFAELCGGNDMAFLLVCGSGVESAIRVAVRRHFPDMPPSDQEDSVAYALMASGATLGDPEGWLYPSDGFWLSTAKDAGGASVVCGGELDAKCPVCQRALRRLVTLAPVPAILGVTGLDQLTLAACVLCLALRRAKAWWLPHDSAGQPVPVSLERRSRREFVPVDVVIDSQAVNACLTPIPARFRTPLLPGDTRVGGPPVWIQDGEYPDCPRCGVVMTFLAHFAQDSPDGGGWMDMLYVHWCDNCRVSHYLLQNS